ncbi:MAG: polyprenyl diphosphate synthase [Chloroflexota bacterium]
MKATVELPPEITRLPGHVAIIMDGNRRWADKQSLPRIKGHEAGLENMLRIVDYLNDYGIKYVTFFAFSTENWNRPQHEVKALMQLVESRIDKVAGDLHKRNIRLRHLGGLDKISLQVQNAIARAVALTRDNTGITLSLAFNYGGRSDIVHAARRLIREGVPAEAIDEELFSRYLYTDGLPDVDLLIRTGGEFRISNFLIWQSAYSEYFFSDVFWPDFDKAALDSALLTYSRRQRRFGRL